MYSADLFHEGLSNMFTLCGGCPSPLNIKKKVILYFYLTAQPLCLIPRHMRLHPNTTLTFEMFLLFVSFLLALHGHRKPLSIRWISPFSLWHASCSVRSPGCFLEVACSMSTWPYTHTETYTVVHAHTVARQSG